MPSVSTHDQYNLACVRITAYLSFLASLRLQLSGRFAIPREHIDQAFACLLLTHEDLATMAEDFARAEQLAWPDFDFSADSAPEQYVVHAKR